MLKTKEYYKILHFLKVESVDRIYPVEEYFYNEDDEPIVFVGNSFLFKTNRQQFSGLDYVEVLLESSVQDDGENLQLNISEYEQGYDPVMVLTGNKKTIPVNTPTRIVFEIRKSQTMSEASRNLTNIKSIELVTSDNSNFKRKPDSYSIDYLTDKYGLDRNDTYYVGDRRIDMECSKNSKIKSIYYYNGIDEYIESNYMIKDFIELKKVF